MNKKRFIRVRGDLDILKILYDLGLKGHISNKDFICCCPYHNEKSPSMGVKIFGEGRGVFRCMSANCGVSGNIYDLISHITGKKLENVISEFESDIDIKRIIDLRSFFKNSLEEKKEFKLKYLKESFLNKYQDLDGEFLKYVLGRKINEETIKLFGIKQSTNGLFKNRVIIPVRDENGKLVSVVARSILKDIDKKYKVRKLKDTDVKKVLFGMNNIIEKVKENKKIILTEGEFDVIYGQGLGLQVAGMGNTSLEKEQRRTLLKYVQKVFLCLDGDVNYEDEKVKKKIYFLKKHFSLFIYKMGEDDDMNTLNKKEIEKIKILFERF